MNDVGDSVQAVLWSSALLQVQSRERTVQQDAERDVAVLKKRVRSMCMVWYIWIPYSICYTWIPYSAYILWVFNFMNFANLEKFS